MSRQQSLGDLSPDRRRGHRNGGVVLSCSRRDRTGECAAVPGGNGAGGFIISLIVGDIKRHNELQRNSDEQGQWFQDLANDGLAAGDWADKLEYLRYSYSWYGNDNTDANRSHFEFQQAAWNDFHSKPKEGGSSMSRLNNDLHVHTDKTTLAPPEQAYLATEGQVGS